MLFLKYEEMQKVCNCFIQILTVLDRVPPTRTHLLGQRIVQRKIMIAKLTTIIMSVILNSNIFSPDPPTYKAKWTQIHEDMRESARGFASREAMREQIFHRCGDGGGAKIS